MSVRVSPVVELEHVTDQVTQFNAGEQELTPTQALKAKVLQGQSADSFASFLVNDFLLRDIPESLAAAEMTPEPVYYSDFTQIREDITRAFEINRFGTDNFSSKNVCCPFHDDQHPSASLHREKGLYCHACARWFTWKELAAALGIPWQFEKPVEEPDRLSHSGDIVGMSREARRAFIAAGLTNLARVLDVLIDLERGGEVLTFREFSDSVLPSVRSVRCVRTAFDQLRGMKLPQKRGGEFLTDFFLSYSLQHKESKKSAKNSKRGRQEGRPQETVRVPTPAEITDAANVTPAIYYGMNKRTIGDPAEYRAACMADVIRRKPGKYSRKQLATPLGISYPTIRAYCDRAGIVRTKQPPKLTELTPEEVTQLPADHKALKLALLQKHIKSNVYLQDERGIRHEYTQAGAKQAATMGGGKLYRAEYQASDYRPDEVTA